MSWFAPNPLMASIKIPDASQRTVMSLATQSDEEFGRFCEALSHAEPRVSKDAFLTKVAESFPEVEQGSVRRLANELFNINYLREELDLSPEEVVPLIVDEIHRSASPEEPFSDEGKARLSSRLLSAITANPAIRLTAKAADVVTDQDRVFLRARVLTDFRPIFDDSASKVDAGAIVHSLTIHFAQDDDHKDFYVALDTSDLKTLREALERAEKKATALEAVAKRAGVVYLEP